MLNEGVAPPLEASVPQARSRVPLGWVPCPGEAWHSVQAMALRSEPAFRWAWWAPTPAEVVALLPVVSLGGAAGRSGLRAVATRVASPWQPVQPVTLTSTLPFTWSEASTEVEV